MNVITSSGTVILIEAWVISCKLLLLENKIRAEKLRNASERLTEVWGFFPNMGPKIIVVHKNCEIRHNLKTLLVEINPGRKIRLTIVLEQTSLLIQGKKPF